MVSAKKLCYVAVLTALTVVLSSFSVPVPGGHFYLNDIAICFAALAFDPLSAFIVGGVGAFLGDFFFYPAPMFVSLASHGLQAVAISLISGGGKALKKGFLSAEKRELPRFYLAVAGLLTGMVIMVTGYTLGRAFVYATKEYAIIKLPFEILQAGVGAVIAPILAYKTPLKKVFFAVIKKKEETQETPPEENSEKN